MLHSVCVHRRHLRLDSLRTLVLADNQFTRIQLCTDDNGEVSGTEDDEPERVREFEFSYFAQMIKKPFFRHPKQQNQG